MPYVIEDTIREEGQRFFRKLPAGRSMWTSLNEATVFRTRELAEKDHSSLSEYFDVPSGEVIPYAEHKRRSQEIRDRHYRELADPARDEFGRGSPEHRAAIDAASTRTSEEMAGVSHWRPTTTAFVREVTLTLVEVGNG